MTFAIIVDIVFILIIIFLTDFVLAAAGAGRAAPLAIELGRTYVRTTCLQIPFFALGTLFQLVLVTYGYRIDSVINSVISVVTNIVSSIAFIRILPENYRIAGPGLGSVAGAFALFLAALIMIRKKGIKLRYRFYPPNKENIIDILDMLRRGFPSSVDNMLDSVSGSVVNRIIPCGGDPGQYPLSFAYSHIE